MHQELVICGGKAGEKVVFEGLNDTFGGVEGVTMWGGKLVFDAGFSDIILEGLDVLVVEAL